MIRKRLWRIGLILLSCIMLCGCGSSRSKGYDALSAEQKKIVDDLYLARDTWEITDITYGGVRVTGEEWLRSVSIVSCGGGIGLRVTYSINPANDELVRVTYSYQNGVVQKYDTDYAVMQGKSWSKSWYTSWSETEKKDYLAQLLLDFHG